jgi:hypothetical protein
MWQPKDYHVRKTSKIKFALEHVMKAPQGSRGIAPFLTSVPDGGGHRHAPDSLPPGKAGYPLHRRLVGPHGQSAGCGKYYRAVKVVTSQHRLCIRPPENNPWKNYDDNVIYSLYEIDSWLPFRCACQ